MSDPEGLPARPGHLRPVGNRQPGATTSTPCMGPRRQTRQSELGSTSEAFSLSDRRSQRHCHIQPTEQRICCSHTGLGPAIP
jgi:hypothetical protein